MAEVLQFRSDRAYFSQRPPEKLHRMLDIALEATDPATTEYTLVHARSRWPNEPDAHIALYKFYFVAAQYEKAERSVWVALKRAAAMGGFDRNYRRLTPASAEWEKRGGPERFYLFSMKALGVCRLRRGRVHMAYSVLQKLHELDISDEIGGAAYLQIAASFFDDE